MCGAQGQGPQQYILMRQIRRQIRIMFNVAFVIGPVPKLGIIFPIIVTGIRGSRVAAVVVGNSSSSSHWTDTFASRKGRMGCFCCLILTLTMHARHVLPMAHNVLGQVRWGRHPTPTRRIPGKECPAATMTRSCEPLRNHGRGHDGRTLRALYVKVPPGRHTLDKGGLDGRVDRHATTGPWYTSTTTTGRRQQDVLFL